MGAVPIFPTKEISMTPQLTHIDAEGDARMVDVSAKAETKRTAIAEGFVVMRPETLAAIEGGTAKKGDVLAAARIAGIMAAKQTSNLIPLCHPLALTKVEVKCTPQHAEEREDGRCGIHLQAACSLVGKTGVEMEALTAVSIAGLTVYDMCKAIDRGMELDTVRLVHKEGGKTGVWDRQ